jgi:hypothetical protein
VPAEVPLKLQVLRALTTHLEGIVGEEWGGYVLTGCVFRGRNRFGDDTPETFLSILEAPRPDVGREGGENNASRAYEWLLLLQGWTLDDAVNPSDPCYFLQEQVERRLQMIVEMKMGSGRPKYPEVYMLGNLVTSFAYGPGVVRPPTDGLSSKAFLYIPLRVGLATTV